MYLKYWVIIYTCQVETEIKDNGKKDTWQKIMWQIFKAQVQGW